MPDGPRVDLSEAVKGEYRDALIAIRDYLAHELESNRCKTCASSQLRTGDTAALVLRLTKVMEEIEGIPEHKMGEVSELDRIRGLDRASASQDSPRSPKSLPRRQGGRRPSGTRRDTA